jgi:hypothetical protein
MYSCYPARMNDSPAFPPLFPVDPLRRALQSSLHHAHQPELADVVDSAELTLDRSALGSDLPGLWLRPLERGLGRAWLADTLFAAAVQDGLPLAWIRIVPAGGEG